MKEDAFVKDANVCSAMKPDEVECMPLAMCYVPWQQMDEVFTGEYGLSQGTIFPELVKPFWITCGLGR